CEKVGRQMLLQGRLHGPESLSRELFVSALDLMDNQDLLVATFVPDEEPVEGQAPEGLVPEDASAEHADPGPGDLASRRLASAAYARDLVRRVRAIETMDASIRAEVTGVPH